MEYEPDAPPVDFSNPLFADMKRVFDRFTTPKEQQPDASAAVVGSDGASSAPSSTAAAAAASASDDEDEAAGGSSSASSAGLSRRALKAASRLTLSELKQLSSVPAVVDAHDANSPDPKLLVHLKAASNSVPVPPHWSAKKRYLSSKRGYEKLPFQLPDFIVNTGISRIRGLQLEKEAERTSKSRQRDRMRPRMGAIDIDYQILHDAFFRYQTKPQLTALGELYYEGKEFEVKLSEKRPLHFSPALLAALGMPSAASPPPWLFAMQRHGPPPSYPFLRVPGVNAPLPAGGRWGLGEGEWGKPPVDELGRGRWGGELFGAAVEERKEVRVEARHWGQIESEDEAEEEEEEEEEDEAGKAEAAAGTEAKEGEEEEDAGAAAARSGIESVGLATPSTLNLRKGVDGVGTETPSTVHPARQQLYTVLEEKAADRGAGLLGVTHTYVIPSVDDEVGRTAGGRAAGGAGAAGAVAVALDPAELEGLDAETLKRKYEAQQERKEEEAELMERGVGKAGAEDVIAQQKKKRKTKEKEKFKF